MFQGRDDRYRFWKGDCNTLLKDVPSRSVDFVCTDPPYNMSAMRGGTQDIILDKGTTTKRVYRRVADWDVHPLNPTALCDEFRRCLKDTGNVFVFTSFDMIPNWSQALKTKFGSIQCFVWHKTNPMTSVRKKSFLSSCEYIMCAWNEGHQWNFRGQNEMHNFAEGPKAGNDEYCKIARHPTQKPLWLMRKLIQIASPPNGTVLDPFSGTGTTGVAALELDRRFIGMEQNQVYYDAALRRLKGAR